MDIWESEAIKKSPLFSGISDQEFVEVTNCIQPKFKCYLKGEIIFQAGSLIEWFGIIIKGRVSAYHESADGERMLLYTATPGGITGVMAAVFTENAFSINFIADADCEIVLIRSFIMRRGCQMVCRGKGCVAHQKIINNFISIMIDKACYLYKRTVFLTMKSVQQKVCAYLLDQQRTQGINTFVITMDRTELADYLNMPRPSLSRELCVLKNKGIIDFHKFTFSILNFPAITQYASKSD